MLTKSLMVSVALGTVGLAGMCGYLWKQSKRTSACVKNTEDLKVARKEGSKILNLSAGTWGHTRKHKNSTSIKKCVDHMKAKKNTHQFLSDSANLIPILANVEYYATNPEKERQPEIVMPETRTFNENDRTSTITISLGSKDIQNVMFPLNVNPSVQSFRIDYRQHKHINVLAWVFPSVYELKKTIRYSIIPPTINNVKRNIIVCYNINFQEKTLTMSIPKTINLLSICDPRPDTDIPQKTIERRSDRALKNIEKTLKTNSIGKNEHSTIIVRKADIPLEIKKMKDPVAIVNEIYPCIDFHHEILSNSPATVKVTAQICEQIFEADAPTIQEAKNNVCIDALEVFYNYEHPCASNDP